MTMTGVSG